MKRRDFPNIQEQVWEGKLPNGLTIQVVPKPGFTRKSAYLITDFGSIDMDFETEAGVFHTPAGVAHYLEHKMFDMPDGRDIMAEFAALGANTNAFTDYTMTAYLFSCTERFEECLGLLLDFVFTPWFTEESVEKERGIIAQEIRMYDDAADSRVYEALAAAIHPDHPARIPIAGSVESIGQITRQTLMDCYRAFYTPANMVLCVVGDVDPATVEAIAREKTPSRSHALPRRLYDSSRELRGVKPLVVQEMDVSMPMFQLGFKCESAGKGPDSYRRETVGDLAAEILFGESSELYLRLYDEGLIDSSLGGGYEDNKGAAMLTCGGDSEDPCRVMEEVLAQAEKIVRQGIDDTELRRLIRSAMGRRVRGLDSFDGYCYRLGSYYLDGADYLDFQTLYPSITAEEIRQFIRVNITKERACLSVVRPRSQEETEHGICE